MLSFPFTSRVFIFVSVLVNIPLEVAIFFFIFITDFDDDGFAESPVALAPDTDMFPKNTLAKKYTRLGRPDVVLCYPLLIRHLRSIAPP